jgi:hypothetical protein
MMRSESLENAFVHRGGGGGPVIPIGIVLIDNCNSLDEVCGVGANGDGDDDDNLV